MLGRVGWKPGECSLLSNDQYQAAQQAGNGGLNVPSLNSVGTNGSGNITDANGNTVGTATYSADNPGIDPFVNGNQAGYNQLANTSRVVTAGTALYAGIYAGATCAVGCPGAAAAALSNLRTLTGLLPAVPSAIDKLQKIGISLQRAREIVQNEEGYVDNANSGMFGTGSNVNYIVNEGGKMIRITTDAAGTKIISAGRVAENFVSRGVSSGRLTPR
jgi:hypothetical protein